VLRPGGVFAGNDSLGGSFVFWLFHITDTFGRVAPERLADRLQAAGFVEPSVHTVKSSLRFTARNPADGAVHSRAKLTPHQRARAADGNDPASRRAGVGEGPPAMPRLARIVRQAS
jgi:hypothetical protein